MSEERIRIEHEGIEAAMTTPEEMATLAGSAFPLGDRVEGGGGEAFDFAAWYGSWRAAQGLTEASPRPTHLKVEAADTFEALIPWAQLQDAAFQFAQDGKPLAKGGPIRLYAPNGSSECLNVKSVVVCRFLRLEQEQDEASYGFKNTFSPQEMLKKR
ncbi:hypothetical protein [Paenibacillus methanolicus]|uniref:Molybdopterin-dependent oxidoreductase-like protein n=1 Tax=Paenibacillus methanolicus TaxID=582686 RepID=A0A5S5BXZ9_9BACL|nr:hypothetical protein [Paenibacillus methanolicus]TYP71198.1 hypothetical protein BCM02_110148 [Paenibacillus methanolicus]